MNKQKIETAPKDGTVINTDVGFCRYVRQKDWGSPVPNNKWILCDAHGDLCHCVDEGYYICEPTVWFPPHTEALCEFMLDLLGLLAEHYAHDMVWWRTDEDYAPITFFVNANDLFAWGCSDAVTVTAENLPLLKQAIADCNDVDPVLGIFTAFSLFACRVEKMRPQGAAYPRNEAFWPLFDACGPERQKDLGNPYYPGQYYVHTTKNNT